MIPVALSIRRLLQGERADLIFTDPPYNVPIDGHVCGLGRIRHREFAMGAGEMSSEAFTGFLHKRSATPPPSAATAPSRSCAWTGATWANCSPPAAVFSELKNLCVWNKTNGGMGSFYRSKHELVFVFKVGDAPHTNAFGLGDTGRYRTNVWDYAGVNTLRPGRAENLPRTRPSSRSPSSPTPSRTAPGAARSCSTPLVAPAPR